MCVCVYVCVLLCILVCVYVLIAYAHVLCIPIGTHIDVVHQ